MSSYIFHVGIIKRKKVFYFLPQNAAAAAVGLFYMYASALRRATLGRVNPWFKSTHMHTGANIYNDMPGLLLYTHHSTHFYIHSQL